MATVVCGSDWAWTPTMTGEFLIGDIIDQTASSVTIWNDRYISTYWKGTFSGTFQTQISGDVTGRVTDYVFTAGRTTLASITGLDLDAAKVLTCVGQRDAVGLQALMFAGNDVFDLRGHFDYYGKGQIANGFLGDDLMTGSAGPDLLIGGGGRDSLHGGLAADTLKGGSGADLLYGDAGNDRLQGDEGNDGLYGGWDNDTLSGGDGGDVLDGSLGDDLLSGEGGADALTGGLGADRFVFKTAAEALGDRITDFSTAQGDKIDLRGIDASLELAGNQAFRFLGALEFDHHARALRIETTASGLVVQGDADGDGLADFTLALDGVASLSASDFLL